MVGGARDFTIVEARSSDSVASGGGAVGAEVQHVGEANRDVASG